jgi:predicted O-linked N-acetylglucosamine transferase (SPINDLY family)
MLPGMLSTITAMVGFLVDDILLCLLNYDSTLSPEEIFNAHLQWAHRHAGTCGQTGFLAARGSHDKEYRLRVGYVSPDFRNHSVAWFFEPLLASHHREKSGLWYSTWNSG